MKKLSIKTKYEQFNQVAEYRKKLYKKVQLRNLFLELTENCNEKCLHCGSNCGMEVVHDELTLSDYKHILDTVKEDFGTKGYMLCITGGEPLLRKDFFEIMGYANELGINWGMTSNGTLITKEIAGKLAKVGMKTISISIDGLEESHDAFRQTKGGYKRALEGVQNLIDEGSFKHIQITTVVTHQNIGELEELFEVVKGIDVDSWRVINLEPMGRAKEHPELLLTPEDYKYLFNFIQKNREQGWPICYGCSHYLGMELEHETRDWYYLCNAGLYTASITSKGEILACLDIERRPELVQGDIHTDRFGDVWKNRFERFRDEKYKKCDMCEGCSEWDYCVGDSYHSWDFEAGKPGICFKGILF